MREATAADIPGVKGAFNGTSWTPEKREESAIKSYLDHMVAVKIEFDQWRTPENGTQMDEALEAYRVKYASLYNAYLSAHGRVASAAITGGSNFPTRRMQKRGATADKRVHEWMGWSDRRLAQLRDLYDPKRIARAAAKAPISSDNPVLAVAQLQDRIDKAEKVQELMKAANKIVRNGKLTAEEKVLRLTTLVGSEHIARKLLQPDSCNRLGFADYQLTNNNANIRRMKARIAELELAAKRESDSDQRGDITIERNVNENRLQIFFPDKPVAAVRDVLKSNGFHWSPSIGCWQRQLNDHATYAFENHIWPVIARHYETTNKEERP